MAKLPAWIAQSLVTVRQRSVMCLRRCAAGAHAPSGAQVNGSFGEAHLRLHGFFRDRAAAAAAEAAASQASAPAPAEA